MCTRNVQGSLSIAKNERRALKFLFDLTLLLLGLALLLRGLALLLRGLALLLRGLARLLLGLALLLLGLPRLLCGLARLFPGGKIRLESERLILLLQQKTKKNKKNKTKKIRCLGIRITQDRLSLCRVLSF